MNKISKVISCFLFICFIHSAAYAECVESLVLMQKCSKTVSATAELKIQDIIKKDLKESKENTFKKSGTEPQKNLLASRSLVLLASSSSTSREELRLKVSKRSVGLLYNVSFKGL